MAKFSPFVESSKRNTKHETTSDIRDEDYTWNKTIATGTLS